jgi:predicted transcriptional regulator
MSIWRIALVKAVSSQNLEAIRQVTERILSANAVPVYDVVEELAKAPRAVYQYVKEGIRRKIAQRLVEVQEQEKELADLDARLAEVLAVNEKPAVAVSRGNCAVCEGPIGGGGFRYFICGHGYHRPCLARKGETCPKCAPSHSKQARAKQEQFDAQKANPDVLAALNESNDPKLKFQRLLVSSFFADDLAAGGEQNVRDFVARLQNP